MLFRMTIERTVEVPESRRIMFDIPAEFPAGERVTVFALAPDGGLENARIASYLEHRADWEAAFPLKPGETAKPLYGLFESDGHEVDRFLEEKHREIEAENAADMREAIESADFAQ
jgi:hypothetical protein